LRPDWLLRFFSESADPVHPKQEDHNIKEGAKEIARDQVVMLGDVIQRQAKHQEPEKVRQIKDDHPRRDKPGLVLPGTGKEEHEKNELGDLLEPGAAVVYAQSIGIVKPEDVPIPGQSYPEKMIQDPACLDDQLMHRELRCGDDLPGNRGIVKPVSPVSPSKMNGQRNDQEKEDVLDRPEIAIARDVFPLLQQLLPKVHFPDNK